MKRKFLSLALALALCLSLTVPAFAAEEQKITVGDESYTALLQAIMSQEEDEPVTAKLETDVQLTATLVIGSSDYDGMFGGAVLTVTSHDVTVDLNGNTLTSAEGAALFEIQDGYTLTIIDTSADKTGKLVTQGEGDVIVDEGGVYVPLTAEAAEVPEAAETPDEPETPAVVNPFTDVAETSPFYDAILWAVDQGITMGTTDTTFSPSNTCSVSNILTFLWRAEGKPGAEEGVADRDCAAAWAMEKGMIQDTDAVGDSCTRLRAVCFMWIAAGSPETEPLDTFTDVDAAADYAPAVAWAVENGITMGYTDGTFAPDNTCTRGQIVTFLYRDLAE